jgi:hypothetical protein
VGICLALRDRSISLALCDAVVDRFISSFFSFDCIQRNIHISKLLYLIFFKVFIAYFKNNLAVKKIMSGKLVKNVDMHSKINVHDI